MKNNKLGIVRFFKVNIGYLFLLVVVCCGLPYCIKIPFEEKDLEWIPSYEEGDIVIYTSISDGSKRDSLFILEKFIYNPPNTSRFDLEECNSWLSSNNYVRATATVEYRYVHGTIQSDKTFLSSVSKKEKGKSANLSFNAFEVSYRTERSDTLKGRLLKLQGGVQLNDCFYINRSDGIIRKSITNIHQDIGVEKYVWSKSKGLVSYTLNTGEEYQLYRHIDSLGNSKL